MENTKKGFSLTEVLIALGIIGLVSVMTIPTLLNKYKEKRTSTHLKKIYSQLSQAYYETIGDGYNPCSINSWNKTCSDELIWTRQTEINQEFMLQFVSKFKVARTATGYFSNGKFWTPTYYIKYKTLSNKGTLGIYNMSTYAFQLLTGELIMFGGSHGGPFISVDLDGFGQGKDTVGEDLFFFKVYDTGIRPMGAKGTFSTSSNGENCGCSKNIGADSSTNVSDSAGNNVVSGGCCAAYYLGL
jgi:prepilin-type N-terminal cleavage/methylation domain-containing protein